MTASLTGGFLRIEVDDVDAGRSGIDPALRHGDGVVAEDRLALEVALDEAHALAAADIDGRDDVHGSRIAGEF
jgi:hypothetical protein